MSDKKKNTCRNEKKNWNILCYRGQKTRDCEGDNLNCPSESVWTCIKVKSRTSPWKLVPLASCFPSFSMSQAHSSLQFLIWRPFVAPVLFSLENISCPFPLCFSHNYLSVFSWKFYLFWASFCCSLPFTQLISTFSPIEPASHIIHFHSISWLFLGNICCDIN